MAIRASQYCAGQETCDPKGTGRQDQGCPNCQNQIRRNAKRGINRYKPHGVCGRASEWAAVMVGKFWRGKKFVVKGVKDN